MKIKIIKTNIDVSDLKEEIDLYPENWKIDTSRQRLSYPQKNTETIRLVTGIRLDKDSVWSTTDSEKSIKTELYPLYKKTITLLKTFFPNNLERIFIVKLLANQEVYPHVDQGRYYQTRDRYHLCINGRYQYTVDGETAVIEPGTLFWFNNKLVHSSRNLENIDRISIIFDVKNENSNTQDGDAVVIPEGMRHNVINTSDDELKLYVLYSPPEHPDALQQNTKN